MRTVTCLLAFLIGYYWERCPVCGRGIAYLADGRMVTFCSKRAHRHRHEEPR